LLALRQLVEDIGGHAHMRYSMLQS
jgi:hypothetical protein